jgi:Flp pilus assembly protein TadD
MSPFLLFLPLLLQQPPSWQQQQRGVPQGMAFIAGRVATSDGAQPPEPPSIQAACRDGQAASVAPDAKGLFRITVTRVSATDRLNTGFHDCEVRAVLPGYNSRVATAPNMRFSETFDVGVIVLTPLRNVQGRTVSATSLEAPRDALKAFQQGLAFAKRGQFESAARSQRAAVDLFPRYAEAWFELGLASQRLQRPAEARDAFQRSVDADPMFVKPYLQLIAIHSAAAEWPAALASSARVVRLDPFDYPEAFFHHALASYQLHDPAAAEKSAREAIRLDDAHRLPQAHHLLGVILLDRGDLPGAAASLRAYLQYASDPQLAETVRRQLAEVETRLAAQPR